MAYQSNTARAPYGNNNGNQAPQREQAAAFVNYYLAGKNGRIKTGAFPLNVNVPREKKLLEWLQADPANVEKFKKNLEITFQVNDGGADFELPE